MAELFLGDRKLNTGNVSIAVTGTAIKLSSGSNQPSNSSGILIKASLNNVNKITVGGSASLTNTTGANGNGFELSQGDTVLLPIQNFNDIYINGTAGDYVSYIGN